MPYKTIGELPDQFDGLPAKAKRIAMNVINSALADGDSEESAFKQAWSQVKKSYKKVGDKWVAKEAKVKVREKMSAEDRRGLLQAAINEKFPRDAQAYPYSPSPWVRDVYDDSVVYELGGSTFEVGYTMTEEGKVTLGEETKKVIATTSYKPLESLREKHAELIQEAGERGISGTELREVTEQCTTLIESDIPDDAAVDLALSALDEAIKWVKSQEANKTEDGETYPASAFAYVPDTDKPSTWKLRLWETPEKKETIAQVGRAAASFSPGGDKGKKAEITESAVAGVKAKIRAAYGKLGVKPEDMSKWVLDFEVRERIAEACEIDIQEVTKEGIAKGVIPVRILVPGFNYGESRYYSEKAVSDAAEIFNGAKMFSDHATEAQEEAMPERSIQDWVATLHETKMSESGNAVGVAHINAGWLKEKIANLYEQGDLQHLGTSINCLGQGTKQTIEGKKTMLIEGLSKGTFGSVDFVTEAGAGGQAGLRESARESILDAELIDLAQLREARPDLVKVIEADIRESLRQEVKEAMEATKEIEDLTKQVDTLTTENGELKTTIEEAEKEKAKAEAQATIKDAVDKAELPEAAKTRLVERFAEATTDEGLEAAIKAEAEYIRELTDAGKVKGLGGVTPEAEAEAGTTAYRESLERTHPNWTEKELDIAVAGR